MYLFGNPSRKKEESQLIMDLFPAIGKAIQQLQGTECSEHLQTVNALNMMPTLLQYGPNLNIINFLHFYQNLHTRDEVPKPTLRTMDAEYATIGERTVAMQHHTAYLQRPKNSRIQLYTKCLESILVPSTPCPTSDLLLKIHRRRHRHMVPEQNPRTGCTGI